MPKFCTASLVVAIAFVESSVQPVFPLKINWISNASKITLEYQYGKSRVLFFRYHSIVKNKCCKSKVLCFILETNTNHYSNFEFGYLCTYKDSL